LFLQIVSIAKFTVIVKAKANFIILLIFHLESTRRSMFCAAFSVETVANCCFQHSVKFVRPEN